jgi:phenylpropionate dioxygenase-like ring-hydroxylating dioxygenase large terminal subunit
VADGVSARDRARRLRQYRILDQSIIVVRRRRHDQGVLQCLPPSGDELVDDRGNCGGFICPFHGWCWNLDGSNSFVYQAELFSEAALDPTPPSRRVPGDVGQCRS